MLSTRALNAFAVQAAGKAVTNAQQMRHKLERGHQESVLNLQAAVKHCNDALVWGCTPEVVRDKAASLHEIGLHYLLDSKDAEAIACFHDAMDCLNDIEPTFEGIDKVLALKTEVKLGWAKCLAATGQLYEAGSLLAELDQTLPKSSSDHRRAELCDQQKMLASLRRKAQQNGGSGTKTSSVEAMVARGKRRQDWAEARTQQLEAAETKRRQKRANDDDDDDDQPEIVGVRSRKDREAQRREQAIDLEAEQPSASSGTSSSSSTIQPQPQPPQSLSQQQHAAEPSAPIQLAQPSPLQQPMPPSTLQQQEQLQQPPSTEALGGASMQARLSTLETNLFGEVKEGALFARIHALDGHPDGPPQSVPEARARLEVLEAA